MKKLLISISILSISTNSLINILNKQHIVNSQIPNNIDKSEFYDRKYEEQKLTINDKMQNKLIESISYKKKQNKYWYLKN